MSRKLLNLVFSGFYDFFPLDVAPFFFLIIIKHFFCNLIRFDKFSVILPSITFLATLASKTNHSPKILVPF